MKTKTTTTKKTEDSDVHTLWCRTSWSRRGVEERGDWDIQRRRTLDQKAPEPPLEPLLEPHFSPFLLRDVHTIRGHSFASRRDVGRWRCWDIRDKRRSPKQQRLEGQRKSLLLKEGRE